jgi:allantoate deiminase
MWPHADPQIGAAPFAMRGESGMGHATGEKILPRLLLLGQFGQEGGIYFRTPFTSAEAAAIDRIREWMQEVGLTVRRDAVGNLIGRIQGRDRAAKVVATGSHLDSVRDGGVFDGPLGVLAGIEVVGQLLAERGEPEVPVEVSAFTGEEGSRFPLGLLGSRLMAGLLGTEEVMQLQDRDGVRLGEALARTGLDSGGLDRVARDDLSCLVANSSHGPSGYGSRLACPHPAGGGRTGSQCARDG